jgi:mRNA interferase MazF
MTTKGISLSASITPARGQIWRVDFNPVRGDEIMKIRPAVVISSDAFSPLKTKIVVPLTGWQDKFTNSQWMVKIIVDTNNGLDHDSAADALQLRCVSYERFIQKLGSIPAPVLDEIAAAIAIAIEFQ